MALTAFGKAIRKSLIDKDKSVGWLLEAVTEKTGLYFDNSYLSKISAGKLGSPKIISAICEILDIQMEVEE